VFLLTQFGLLLYFIGILIKNPDDDRESDRNMYVTCKRKCMFYQCASVGLLHKCKISRHLGIYELNHAIQHT